MLPAITENSLQHTRIIYTKSPDSLYNAHTYVRPENNNSCARAATAAATTSTTITITTTTPTRYSSSYIHTFMHNFFAAASSMSFAQFFSKNSRMLLLLLPPMALAFQAEYVPAGSVCEKQNKTQNTKHNRGIDRMGRARRVRTKGDWLFYPPHRTS